MKNLPNLIFVLIIPLIGFSQKFERSKLTVSNSSDARIVELKYLHDKDPENLSHLLELGDLTSFQKDWDNAIYYYQKATSIAPNNADYNFKLGGAYGMKALSVPKIQALIYINDIKTNLERAAKLDPKHIEARRALVEVYMQLPGILGGSLEVAKKYSLELKSISRVEHILAEAFIKRKQDGLAASKDLYLIGFRTIKEKKNIRNGLNYEFGKIAADLNVESNYGINLLNTYISNYSYKDIYSLEWVYLRMAQIYANLNQKAQARKYIQKSLTLRGDFKEALEEKKRIESL